MMAAARRIRFGGSLQLPSVRVAASDLESLEPGMLLRLDLAANTMPVLRVGGQSLHRARAIRQGPHRAARLEAPVVDEPMGAERSFERAIEGPALERPVPGGPTLAGPALAGPTIDGPVMEGPVIRGTDRHGAVRHGAASRSQSQSPPVVHQQSSPQEAAR
jgi:hypothetical protein